MHRLALALGKTVRELADGITLQEFIDWQRFAAEHPFPADLVDIHGAMTVATLANVNRSPTARTFEVPEFRVLRPRAGDAQAAPAKPPPMLEADRMMLAFAGTEQDG